MSPPDSFIRSLISHLDNPNVTGIAMTGSHARGQGNKYSDVDLDIYVIILPENKYDRYTLRYWDGRLISLKSVLIEDELAAVSRPWDAIWAIPGLRQMRILTDKFGKLADLQRVAEEFEWAKLQPAADDYGVEQLMGCAEEVHKILNGLAYNKESTVLYAVWGLLKGLGSGVATQRGLLIESENRYFDIIQDSIGRESEWVRSFRLALGADIVSDIPLFKSRGSAALALYRHTALLFRSIILVRHRKVIENTVQLIQDAGY